MLGYHCLMHYMPYNFDLHLVQGTTILLSLHIHWWHFKRSPPLPFLVIVARLLELQLLSPSLPNTEFDEVEVDEGDEGFMEFINLKIFSSLSLESVFFIVTTSRFSVLRFLDLIFIRNIASFSSHLIITNSSSVSLSLSGGFHRKVEGLLAWELLISWVYFVFLTEDLSLLKVNQWQKLNMGLMEGEFWKGFRWPCTHGSPITTQIPGDPKFDPWPQVKGLTPRVPPIPRW